MRVATREMVAGFHITLSPVTADTVGSDTDFSMSPKANLSLFDQISPTWANFLIKYFPPEQMVLLHKNPCFLLHCTSFHLWLRIFRGGKLNTWCKQCSLAAATPLFGSPRAQNVTFQGLQSTHFQVPSTSRSLAPSHAILRPVLFIPSKTKLKVEFEWTEAKWPPSFLQKSSAAVQFLLAVFHL